MRQRNLLTNERKLLSCVFVCVLMLVLLTGCGNSVGNASDSEPPQNSGSYSEAEFTADTAIQDVTGYPGFGSYGRLILQKTIQGCSFSRGIPVKNLLSAIPEAVLLMLELCTTVSLMRWNCQRKVITRLH